MCPGVQNESHMSITTLWSSIHFYILKIWFANCKWWYTYIHMHACMPCMHAYIRLLKLILMHWQQGSDFLSKGDMWLPLPNEVFHSMSLEPNRQKNGLNVRWQSAGAIEDQANTLNSIAVPIIGEHSDHLTLLPIWPQPWLWRYTWLLVLILMHWQQGSDFESKGDKVSSSAECRIRTQGLCNQISIEWVLPEKSTELSRIKRAYGLGALLHFWPKLFSEINDFIILRRKSFWKIYFAMISMYHIHFVPYITFMILHKQ